MQQILATRDDIQVLSAATAKQGLEIAFNERPELILLDINLPDMDGFDTLKILKENPLTRETPVIAITANAMPRDIERGKTAQFTEYLTKPLDVPELLATIDRCLSS